MFLQGIDPVGTPFLRACELEREVWTAVVMRAERILADR